MDDGEAASFKRESACVITGGAHATDCQLLSWIGAQGSGLGRDGRGLFFSNNATAACHSIARKPEGTWIAYGNPASLARSILLSSSAKRKKTRTHVYRNQLLPTVSRAG